MTAFTGPAKYMSSKRYKHEEELSAMKVKEIRWSSGLPLSEDEFSMRSADKFVEILRKGLRFEEKLAIGLSFDRVHVTRL